MLAQDILQDIHSKYLELAKYWSWQVFGTGQVLELAGIWNWLKAFTPSLDRAHTTYNLTRRYETDCDVIYGDTDSVMVNFKVSHCFVLIHKKPKS